VQSRDLLIRWFLLLLNHNGCTKKLRGGGGEDAREVEVRACQTLSLKWHETRLLLLLLLLLLLPADTDRQTKTDKHLGQVDTERNHKD
jgi:hypothetical protein